LSDNDLSEVSAHIPPLVPLAPRADDLEPNSVPTADDVTDLAREEPQAEVDITPPDEPKAPLNVELVQDTARKITAEIHKAVVGQDLTIQSALAGLFADGHVLLEGVPGTAKTLLVRALSAAVGADFGRIQFTPDLMPSDITGTRIYDMATQTFTFKTGPIFTGLLLADEINRTPPKTQAALLEAMQERRVTIDGEPFDLPPLFMVFGTQNPVEFEGTYPLPEAQLDRFLLKIIVEYPSSADEQQILRRYHAGFDSNELATASVNVVADEVLIAECRSIISKVTVEDALFVYMTQITAATRDHRQVVLGASPRASIALLQVSKAIAAMRGRDYINPDDVKTIAPSVLRHRLILRPEAEIEGMSADRVIDSILDQLEVPR
jgi:MoxR-like ATPase